jgi:hypothetical protein
MGSETKTKRGAMSLESGELLRLHGHGRDRASRAPSAAPVELAQLPAPRALVTMVAVAPAEPAELAPSRPSPWP